MLKFVAIVAATIFVFWLLALCWPAFRRRLKLAFKVAFAVYGIGVIGRLIYFGINSDRLVELAVVTLSFAACWLLVWTAIVFVARRRNA